MDHLSVLATKCPSGDGARIRGITADPLTQTLRKPKGHLPYLYQNLLTLTR